ncbi:MULTISPECIES: DUF4876 domain-containing protein [Prevotellaceae]|uniref:DUF4876 domain-containing protein n=1 Tax=Prevotellaceae TaxID=171552 RepID=UPI0003D31206|nr:DUF4876 domain-containing protein [Prevotella phocaeensis]ETD16505.1 hypothetical protein HMPREF1199_02173 [Hoylesella oralis CC98A]
MKKLISLGNMFAFLMLVIAATFFTACSDSNDTPDVSSSAVKVSVKLASEYNKVALGKVNLTLRNVNSGKETSVEVGTNGIATIDNLPVDMYDVTATYKMSAEDYKNATGTTTEVTDSVLFSASATGIQLEPDKVKELALELNTASTDDFIIKTIYYAGSDNKKAAGENDQFIEIYNNTNRVLYADSLCIAVTTMNRYGNGHKWQDKRYYYTEDGRYDWSKSQDMKDVDGANAKYYYAKMLFMVPGKGKDYPIQPGQSFIIAAFAQNYKAAFTTSTGKQITPEAPELTVDLSKAEFDVVYEGYETLDNPNAANMTIIHKGNNRYMRLSRNGKEGYVIFRHSDPASLPVYLYPAIDPAKGSKDQFMQVPNAHVIDAVEVITPTADGYVAPKAFQKKDDAGYTYSKPDYSSMCITRKISRVDGTRKVLQDINNSTLDFVEMKAEPKAFAPQQ